MNKPRKFVVASLLAAGAITSATNCGAAEDYIPYGKFDAGIPGWHVGWGGQTTVAHDPAQDASTGTGSLNVTVNRGNGDQVVALGNFSGSPWWNPGSAALDLAGYTNVAFKLKWDSLNSTIDLRDFVDGGPGEESLLLWGIPADNSAWFTIGTINVPNSASNAWVSINVPFNPALLSQTVTYGLGIKKWVDAPHRTNCLASFWVDEIVVQALPVAPPPPTVSLTSAGKPGLQVILGDNGNQWQRDAIATQNGNWMWGNNGNTPVTYSFTISDFPQTGHPDFQAHMFIVNRDTSSAFDETYGGCDWNAPDIVRLMITALTNGTYAAECSFKTNMPNQNPPNNPVHIPARVIGSQIIGTWSLTFLNDTNVTLNGPGGVSTNFTIPIEAVQANFAPLSSFIQFGFHKNDDENNGHNNGVVGVFGGAAKTGGGDTFNDTFTSSTLTNNYPWRRTSGSYVQYVAPDVKWDLSWTLPANGFNPQVSSSLLGGWTHLPVVTSYQNAGKVHNYVSQNSLPAGNTAFFRAIKRPFTKLRVLVPGETAAPNTVSGKTGTPLEQTAGVPFTITVNACDDVWNVVSSSDTVNIASSDLSATLPGDTAMAAGAVTLNVAFNSSGSWTLTATNVTDATKLPYTSSAVTVP